MSRRRFSRFMVDEDLGSNLKIGRLSDAEFRALVCGVWAIASKAEPRGAFMVGKTPATAEDVCFLSRDTSKRTANSLLAKLRSMGMLEADDELGGEWVHDWDLVNPSPKADPSNAERQARWRARNAASNAADNASSNAASNADMKKEVETPPTPQGEAIDFDHAKARLKADAEAIERIWAAHVQARVSVFGKQSVPKLSRDRRDLIARRLKEWTEADLVDAVRGWRHIPHNRGENDRRTPYCDLKLLLRDAGQIERFRDAERGAGPAGDEMRNWLGGA